MKKRHLFLLPILIASFMIFIAPGGKVEAATYTSWQSPGGGFSSSCKVRLITDAQTYTTRATTVDAKLEQNGKCGRIDYDMILSVGNSVSMGYGSSQSGYFSNSSPWKSFNLKHVKKTTTTTVVASLYNNKGAYSNIWSKKIKIYGH
ncbi:hypothetical protein CHH58_02295 [Terribacillus saccharophilus]|uniref:cell wall-binding protein n=1 Tax=Terribacillus saccharophilus TaxID=361277 RepID=UPI000BA76DE7|nr:cell wall-binding protein [Terribacillus saccharophilus]PAF38289.1 hypothetical protein CHH58_02295 [Terribacillus saccharophilus]